MSGDNNGRWAGSYSWPLDEAAYFANAQDTVRRLRRFAALLFWGGGNELFPRRLSPPVALEEIVHREDPGRFYIASSMDGGIKGGNMSEHDDEYYEQRWGKYWRSLARFSFHSSTTSGGDAFSRSIFLLLGRTLTRFSSRQQQRRSSP